MRKSITDRLVNLMKKEKGVLPTKGRGAAAMGGAVNPAMGNPEVQLSEDIEKERPIRSWQGEEYRKPTPPDVAEGPGIDPPRIPYRSASNPSGGGTGRGGSLNPPPSFRPKPGMQANWEQSEIGSDTGGPIPRSAIRPQAGDGQGSYSGAPRYSRAPSGGELGEMGGSYSPHRGGMTSWPQGSKAVHPSGSQIGDFDTETMEGTGGSGGKGMYSEMEDVVPRTTPLPGAKKLASGAALKMQKQGDNAMTYDDIVNQITANIMKRTRSYEATEYGEDEGGGSGGMGHVSEARRKKLMDEETGGGSAGDIEGQFGQQEAWEAPASPTPGVPTSNQPFRYGESELMRETGGAGDSYIQPKRQFEYATLGDTRQAWTPRTAEIASERGRQTSWTPKYESGQGAYYGSDEMMDTGAPVHGARHVPHHRDKARMTTSQTTNPANQGMTNVAPTSTTNWNMPNVNVPKIDIRGGEEYKNLETITPRTTPLTPGPSPTGGTAIRPQGSIKAPKKDAREGSAVLDMEKSFTQRLIKLMKAEASMPENTFRTLENEEVRHQEHDQLLREYGFPSEVDPEANRYIPVIETETNDKGIPINNRGPWVVNESGQDAGELLDEDAPNYSTSEKAHNTAGEHAKELKKAPIPFIPFLSAKSM